jgi:membrane-associated phospholipid phosphatase
MDWFDLRVAEWIDAHRVGPLTDASRFLEDLGTSPGFFTIVLLLGLTVVGVRRAWAGLPSAAFALLTTLAVTLPLKRVIDRPRPPADLAITTLYESAMPSSHAILTSACVVAVVLAPWWTSTRWRRLVAVVGVVGCVVSAAAMVYLGGHWVTDVLVGWALGAGVTAAVMGLWRRASVLVRRAGVGQRQRAPRRDDADDAGQDEVGQPLAVEERRHHLRRPGPGGQA